MPCSTPTSLRLTYSFLSSLSPFLFSLSVLFPFSFPPAFSTLLLYCFITLLLYNFITLLYYLFLYFFILKQFFLVHEPERIVVHQRRHSKPENVYEPAPASAKRKAHETKRKSLLIEDPQSKLINEEGGRLSLCVLPTIFPLFFMSYLCFPPLEAVKY